MSAAHSRASLTDGNPQGASGGREARLHGPEDRRIGDGAVVHRLTVDDRDRIDESLLLYAAHHRLVGGHHFGPARIVIDDPRAVTEPVLDLGTDDGRDLLRRPGRTSTTTPAGGLNREVVHLDVDYGLGHCVSLDDVDGAGGAVQRADRAAGTTRFVDGVTVGARIHAPGDRLYGAARARATCGTGRRVVAGAGFDGHSTHGSSFRVALRTIVSLYPTGYLRNREARPVPPRATRHADGDAGCVRPRRHRPSITYSRGLRAATIGRTENHLRAGDG